jgi:hypothetical protein
MIISKINRHIYLCLLLPGKKCKTIWNETNKHKGDKYNHCKHQTKNKFRAPSTRIAVRVHFQETIPFLGDLN